VEGGTSERAEEETRRKGRGRRGGNELETVDVELELTDSPFLDRCDGLVEGSHFTKTSSYEPISFLLG